jgi:hypothetical protein
VYRRGLKRPFHSNGGALCSAAKECRPQRPTSNFQARTAVKPTRLAKSSQSKVIRDRSRHVTNATRPKATQRFRPSRETELTGEELATLLNTKSLPSGSDSEAHHTCDGQMTAERLIIGPSGISPASEKESITDLRQLVDRSLSSHQKNSTKENAFCELFEPSAECSEQHVSRENIGQMLGTSLDIMKEMTGDTDIVPATTKIPSSLVRSQRMQLLKNLAEQLVKRVDEACAKKRQIELAAMEQATAPSLNVNVEVSEKLLKGESRQKAEAVGPEEKVENQSDENSGVPSIQLAGPACYNFEDSEPKFFLQSKQNNILNQRGLSEQEQVGFESRTLQSLEAQPERKKVTVSSSLVVLPTSTNYHMRRIKQSQAVQGEAKSQQAKQDVWTIPADSDKHSIFHVYTQHLKAKTRHSASVETPKLHSAVINSATKKNERDSEIAGREAVEDVSDVPITSESGKMTAPEFPMKPPEPLKVQRAGFRVYDRESAEPPVVDEASHNTLEKQDMPSPSPEGCQKRKSKAEKFVTTSAPDLTNLKTDAIVLSGTLIPDHRHLFLASPTIRAQFCVKFSILQRVVHFLY